jgi:hypothetical protein
MTLPRRWLADLDDPLPQLIADHPDLPHEDDLLVLSQRAALVHWPTIEKAAGRISVVLRRAGSEDEDEWRDHLAMSSHLIAASGRNIRLFALSDDAVEALGAEMQQPVAVLPALPRRYAGARHLTLSRDDGIVKIGWNGTQVRPARQYNLARLRRRALIGADGGDPDLSDLAAFANGSSEMRVVPATRQPVVVVVVPNGVGLGHVTRMLAVARHLRAERGARVVFWSFSRAVGIISHYGFETVLRHTARHTGADADDWQAWETEEFAALLADLQPDLVIQDSHALALFILDALARPGTGAARIALVRRGMWQPHHLSAEALASEELVDLVLEPGDLAASADRGVTRGRARRTGTFATFTGSAPVTLTRPDEILDPRRARKALGLGRGRHCLVSLGGDMLGDRSLFLRHLADAAETSRVKLVWAHSPLASPDPEILADPRIATLSVYPLAPYIAAFDGIVSAAGYNSFHEYMQLFEGPVLLVPKLHSALDDQPMRASYAASRGWAETLPPGESEYATITAFLADLRAGKRPGLRSVWRDGAAEIARTLNRLIEDGDTTT